MLRVQLGSYVLPLPWSLRLSFVDSKKKFKQSSELSKILRKSISFPDSFEWFWQFHKISIFMIIYKHTETFFSECSLSPTISIKFETSNIENQYMILCRAARSVKCQNKGISFSDNLGESWLFHKIWTDIIVSKLSEKFAQSSTWVLSLPCSLRISFMGSKINKFLAEQWAQWNMKQRCFIS